MNNYSTKQSKKRTTAVAQPHDLNFNLRKNLFVTVKSSESYSEQFIFKGDSLFYSSTELNSGTNPVKNVEIRKKVSIKDAKKIRRFIDTNLSESDVNINGSSSGTDMIELVFNAKTLKKSINYNFLQYSERLSESAWYKKILEFETLLKDILKS